MPLPRTVLFDLDGTLSDSAAGILAALAHAFEVNGLPPLEPQTARGLLGPPFYESLPPLIGTALLPDVIGAYRDYYDRAAKFDTTVYPGVVRLLRRLQRAGTTMAVATSKPEHFAVPIVEHLGLDGYFRTVAGDELDGSLGTKALVIGKVLGRLGSPDPAGLLMVGDRSHDIVGARAHGIAAAAVTWGYAQPGELEAARPALICRTPEELAAAVGLDEIDAEAS